MFPAHQLQLEQLACQRAIAYCSLIFHCNFKAVISCKLKGTMVSAKQVYYGFLAGLAQPVEGKVRWNSDEITKQREEYHHQLLYLGHHSGVKPELTAWENLKFYPAD